MQIMMFMGSVCLYIPRLMSFISFPCLAAWEQQNPPRCSPTPSQAHPLTGTPSPHPLFHFPTNIPTLMLIEFVHTPAGIDRGRMLPIYSWISAHTNPAAFPHPRAGFALPFSPWSSRRMAIPSSRWCDPAVLSPFMPTIPSSSVFSAPDIFQTMGWNCSSWFCLKEQIPLYCPDCLSLAVPREGHCPSKDLDSPPNQEKELRPSHGKVPTTHHTSLKWIKPEIPPQTLSCRTLGSFRLGKTLKYCVQWMNFWTLTAGKQSATSVFHPRWDPGVLLCSLNWEQPWVHLGAFLNWNGIFSPWFLSQVITRNQVLGQKLREISGREWFR